MYSNSNPQRQIEGKFAGSLKDFFRNCRVALLDTKMQEAVRMNDETEEVEEASTEGL